MERSQPDDQMIESNVMSMMDYCGDESGAPLLGMLAEIASATLHNETTNSIDNEQDDEDNEDASISMHTQAQDHHSISDHHHHHHQKKVSSGHRKHRYFTMEQIRDLPEQILINLFTDYRSDQSKRIHSYTCKLIPDHCFICFESDGNEDEAKQLIKQHLLIHLNELDSNHKLKVHTKNIKISNIKNQLKSQLNRKHISSRLDKVHSSLVRESVSTEIIKKRSEHSEKSKLLIAIKLNDDSYAQIREDHKNLIEEDVHHHLMNELHPSNNGFGPHLKHVANANHPTVDHKHEQLQLNDHCYTSMDGPIFKKINEPYPISNTSLEQPELPKIITPIFPYIYEPLLPNITQIIEIQTEEKSSDSADEDEQLNQKLLNSLSIEISNNRLRATTSELEKTMAAKCIKQLRLEKGDESRIDAVNSIFICQICKDKTFSTKDNLLTHYRSHAGVKPYECQLCEATFTRQHSLNYHMLIHYNKTRFSCDDCGRHFRHPSHFKEHIRRHTGETPFVCQICSVKFKTRNTYKRHLQMKHSKILTAKGIHDAPNHPTQIKKPCVPRRKYGLTFLHQNIEAIAEYERAKEEFEKSNYSGREESQIGSLRVKLPSISDHDSLEQLLEAAELAI